MQNSTLTLVTIIAEQVLEPKLIETLRELGATGYTATECRGEGSRGLRTGSEHGGNVRIEAIVDDQVGASIFEHLSEDYFANYGVVAWLSEVRVVRRDKYVAR